VSSVCSPDERRWWPKYLKCLTIVAYGAVILDEFIRPTAQEYYKLNNIDFHSDYAKNGMNILPHVYNAIVYHIANLQLFSFFPLVLLSAGFALIYYLFDDMERGDMDLKKFYEMTISSLFATMIIVSSTIESTTSIRDKLNLATVVAVISGTLVLLTLTQRKWGIFDGSKPDSNQQERDRIEV
jgi:hypothetical protein